jgi:transcriptional regulator with XRE-family HTH domain
MSREEIKQIRKQLGWSQERLARGLGLGFSTISRWAFSFDDQFTQYGFKRLLPLDYPNETNHGGPIAHVHR